MNHKEKTLRTGKAMAFVAWIIGLALLTQFFSVWQEKQSNPNQNPTTSYTSSGSKSVLLTQNKWGHYLVDGILNDLPATFMLDTGATDVVIPDDLAEYYQLKRKGSGSSITANGIVRVDKTTIEGLSIGDISLYNVRASLNPGMEKNQPILLGMSVLKQLELQQKEDMLTLTQRN